MFGRDCRVHDVQATWMSQTILFYQVRPGHWRALLPIDVAAAAGRQVLTVRAKDPDSRTIERAYPIAIAARTFPARRITVEAKFVDPPADELPRIEVGAQDRRSDLRAPHA